MRPYKYSYPRRRDKRVVDKYHLRHRTVLWNAYKEVYPQFIRSPGDIMNVVPEKIRKRNYYDLNHWTPRKLRRGQRVVRTFRGSLKRPMAKTIFNWTPTFTLFGYKITFFK